MNATSASSVNFAPKHLSGIDVIDNAWGGLYRGGSYLVYGRAASGRGLLTIMFARTGAAFSESTLFISPDRHKDLMIQAASIGFNLREAHESGIVRLVRVPPLMNLQNLGDDGVSKALWDLVTLIRKHRPTRLVMNDFMPFVAFRSYDRFRNEFIQFLEQIDTLDTTTLLVMPEPANPQSSRVIEFMASQMTGSIHIELADDDGTSTKRRISLIPHIGHIKREVVDYWDLEDLVEHSVAPAEPPSAPGADDSVMFTPTSEQAPSNPFQPTPSVQEPFAPQSTPFAAQPAPPFAAQPQQSGIAPVIPIPTFNPAQAQQFSQPQVPPQVPPQPAAPFTPQQGSPPTIPQAQKPMETPLPPAEAPPVPASQTAAPPSGMHVDVEYTNREAFRRRLQQQFSNRDLLHQSFLLLALRMDRSEQIAARPFDFEFLMDLVSEELRPQDDMLANTEMERLVVYLGDSRPEEAQSFFTRLKDRLRQQSPTQADHLLHSVSAIVVPDGRPFQNAEEFLSYALDEA